MKVFAGVGNIPKWYWNQLKGSRTKHGENITIEEANDQFVKQNGKCVYTGVPLLFGRNLSKKSTTASLDRIDSSKGYSKDNVQWVHKDVNTLKEAFNHNRFVELCQKVADYADVITPIDVFIKSQKEIR